MSMYTAVDHQHHLVFVDYIVTAKLRSGNFDFRTIRQISFLPIFPAVWSESVRNPLAPLPKVFQL